jgi:hypothetical protein
VVIDFEVGESCIESAGLNQVEDHALDEKKHSHREQPAPDR